MNFNTDSTKISCCPYASPLFVFSVDSKDAATTMVIRRKDGGRFPKRPCSFTKKTAVFFLGDRRLNASTACGNPTISPSLIPKFCQSCKSCLKPSTPNPRPAHRQRFWCAPKVALVRTKGCFAAHQSCRRRVGAEKGARGRAAAMQICHCQHYTENGILLA